MFGWFRKAPSLPPDALVERIERVEDHYRRLERRFERLQGEFSALNRYSVDEDDEEEFDELVEEKRHAR